MPVDAHVEAFLEARRSFLARKLMSWDDLKRLRQVLDDVSSGAEFCDACGLCCRADVPVSFLELDRIRQFVDRHPDVLRAQGLMCPFLDFDREKFNHNLHVYGARREPMKPIFCRIYEERPVLCRLYPAPTQKNCRVFQTLEPPNINAALLEQPEPEEDYPNLLIQKYYCTMEWEYRGTPDDVFASPIELHLVPGWWCERGERSLLSRDGPHWLEGFVGVPQEYPTPTEFVLDEWALDLFEELEQPRSYHFILEKYGERVDIEELSTTMIQAELANIVAPVDVALRLNRRKYQSQILGERSHSPG